MSILTVGIVKEKLRGYTLADMAASDIFSLCSNFKGLMLQNKSSFVIPNGTTESYVSIKGTIPVKIRGQVYNIPITIWIRPKHPQVCPLVYVTPTQNMVISQSRYVDSNGKVYMPYLSEWKKGDSDLTTLVQILCATFMEHCPVHSISEAAYGHSAGSYVSRIQPPQQEPHGIEASKMRWERSGSNQLGSFGGQDDIVTLQHQLQEMTDKTQCQVCMDRHKNCVFLCGHGTCQLCAEQITVCPMCRSVVEKKIILFD